MTNSKLKPYMIYSRGLGSEEGAMLVFAHSSREARVCGWKSDGTSLTDEYIDLGARLIKNSDWLYKEANKDKLDSGVAHVIWSPRVCEQCELWGQSEIGEDGLCEDCRELID